MFGVKKRRRVVNIGRLRLCRGENRVKQGKRILEDKVKNGAYYVGLSNAQPRRRGVKVVVE